MKHVIHCMFLTISATAALVGCGSLDDVDSKHDESVNVEEARSPLECGETCISCVDHGDSTTCCFWLDGAFHGCVTN